jgi:predicted ATPase
MNVIVGENNLGKSNLLRAIDFLRGLTLGGIPRSWWPEGKGKGVLSAGIEFEFHQNELDGIETFLRRNSGYTVKGPFNESFGTNLKLKESWHGSDVPPPTQKSTSHSLTAT